MKTLKIFAHAAIFLLVGVTIAHAAGEVGDPCPLINRMAGIFDTLRVLCFAGAAFMILGWAWAFIQKPEDVKPDKLKEKGVGLLVGFALLFGVGIVLQFLPGIFDCGPELFV
jgi:hypothetical protein